MKLELGNVYYYLFMVLILIITVLVSLIVRKRSKRFNHIFIICLLMSAFLLHFVKLLFPPYVNEYPYSFVKASFENICAVSTMVFPWFYFSKSKILKDYMVVVGMMSCIVAIIQPNGLIGQPIYTFDVLRYYYAHLIIWLAPYLMIITKQHQLSLKRIWKIPLIFYGVLILILFNEIILISIGLIERDFNSLFNPNVRNTALVFGLPEGLSSIEWLIDILVPKMFRTIPYGVYAGQKLDWPVIWIIIPSYLVICLFGYIQYLIFKSILKIKLKYN